MGESNPAVTMLAVVVFVCLCIGVVTYQNKHRPPRFQLTKENVHATDKGLVADLDTNNDGVIDLRGVPVLNNAGSSLMVAQLKNKQPVFVKLDSLNGCPCINPTLAQFREE